MNYEDTCEISEILALNGIKVFRIHDSSSYTNSINVYLLDNLSEENAVKNALVPFSLGKGCRKYPSKKLMQAYLDEISVPVFDQCFSRKGEYQVLQLSLEQIQSELFDEPHSFSDSIAFMMDVLLDPLVVNHSFSYDIVEAEKENLRKFIQSKVNYKSAYATSKCYEIMCSDESFRYGEFSCDKPLDSIDAAELFSHFQHILLTLPMVIILTGDVDDTCMQILWDRLSSLKREPVQLAEQKRNSLLQTSPRKMIENMGLNEEIVVMGYRTDILRADKAFYALMVLCNALSGGANPKLYQALRGENGLTYEVYSYLEEFKGLLSIICTTDTGSSEDVLEILHSFMQDIKANGITEDDLSDVIMSLKTLKGNLSSSHRFMADFYLNQILTGSIVGINGFIDEVSAVTPEQVKEAASHIFLDTVYILK